MNGWMGGRMLTPGQYKYAATWRVLWYLFLDIDDKWFEQHTEELDPPLRSPSNSDQADKDEDVSRLHQWTLSRCVERTLNESCPTEEKEIHLWDTKSWAPLKNRKNKITEMQQGVEGSRGDS